MSKVIKIKKGLDIKLKGGAEKILNDTAIAATFAIKPTDFQNLTPKLSVKVDDVVKAGDPLFFDKYHPEVKFTSPVSGKVAAVNRGERRRILEVVVATDGEQNYRQFGVKDPKNSSRDEIVSHLQESGCWPFIIQRPYSVIANPKDKPKAIFISAFDSNPLAPDYDFILQNEAENFQKGLDALAKLTDGDINLSVDNKFKVSAVFENVKQVTLHKISGPHPAGNTGIQIHHIDPINKGDLVWTVNPADVVIIGRLFAKGIFDATRIVALTGSQVKKPRYLKTILGTKVEQILSDNINEGENRYISGNILTGTKISANGYLGFYDSHFTVIPEGKYHEFLGWMLPGLKKFSVSHTFLSWLTPNKEYALDTNTHGGKRAFVFNDEYNKVVPMDVLPTFLLKAILAEDIDKMEQLGIYEISEEDFALCEFICTSKIGVQEIVRKGLNLMQKEMG